MNLMLDIINDYLWNGIELKTPIIQEVIDLFEKNKIEHHDLLEYWFVLDEVEPENIFAISMIMGQISLSKD